MTVQTKREPYVYVVLLGSSVLKLGYSTQDYDRVARRVLHSAKSRNLTFTSAAVIWHREVDKDFERFLLWCAGREWDVTSQCDWFYVGGEDKEQIVERFDNWFRLAEDIDQLDSTSNEDE